MEKVKSKSNYKLQFSNPKPQNKIFLIPGSWLLVLNKYFSLAMTFYNRTDEGPFLMIILQNFRFFS